jgi:hypothetical protein
MKLPRRTFLHLAGSAAALPASSRVARARRRRLSWLSISTSIRTRSPSGRATSGRAADVFGSGGGNGAVQPAVDVKSRHAKIGELTLENNS